MRSANTFSIKADQKIIATLLAWMANATQDKLNTSILESKKNHTKKREYHTFTDWLV